MKQKDSSVGLILFIFSSTTLILALGVMFITVLSFRMQEDENAYYSQFDFSDSGILFSVQKDVSLPRKLLEHKDYSPVWDGVTARNTATDYCLCVYGDGTLTLKVIVFNTRLEVLGSPPSFTKQLSSQELEEIKQAIRDTQVRRQVKQTSSYYWEDTDDDIPNCYFYDGDSELSVSSYKIHQNEKLSDLYHLLHNTVTEEEWKQFEKERKEYLRYDTEYSWIYDD